MNSKRKDTVCVVVNKDFIQKEDKLTIQLDSQPNIT